MCTCKATSDHISLSHIFWWLCTVGEYTSLVMTSQTLMFSINELNLSHPSDVIRLLNVHFLVNVQISYANLHNIHGDYQLMSLKDGLMNV